MATHSSILPGESHGQKVIVHGISESDMTEQLTTMATKARGFPGGASDKVPAYQHRRHKRLGFHPWVRKIVWRRAWQPTPVFLPGESHGQRSLVGYSPWGHKESNMTKATWHAHTH